MNYSLLLVLGILTAVANPDSGKKADDSETLQNAESASRPRDMPTGLPESSSGSSILEDGLIMSHAVVRDYFHWGGGNSYDAIRVMGLTESVMRTGEVCRAVDSWTKLGGDNKSCTLSLQTSSDGLIRFDANICGPSRKLKDWYYSIGAYVNLDPTSVNAPNRKFVDQKEIVKMALTRKWTRGQIDIIGKLSHCRDAMPGSYSSAPFVYNGDGTISAYNGFKLGRDCYYPADDEVSFKDIMTGETRTGSMSDMNEKIITDMHINGLFDLSDNWTLKMYVQHCYTPRFETSESSPGGVVMPSSAAYTYANGSPCSELVQLRSSAVLDMGTNDLQAYFSAQHKTERNTLDLGFAASCAKQFQHSSSFYYAHTASADPERVYLDGRSAWKLNSNALFYESFQYDFSLFASDDWQVNDRLFMRAGARVMAPFYNVQCAADRIDESTGQLTNIYKRYDGFSIAALENSGTPLAEVTQKDIEGCPLDYHFSVLTSYRLQDRLFAVGEGLVSSVNKIVGSFKGNKIPSMKPVCYKYGSLGLTGEAELGQRTALNMKISGTYIEKANNAAIETISNPAGSLVTNFVAEYDIRTWGVTMNAGMSAGNFELRAIATLQDPRYRNYSHTENFDDGSVTTVDYDGKFVVAVPQWRVELNPTYSLGSKFKASANIRYLSRQFASKNNLAYYNGHFETFASASWACSRRCTLSLSVINLLFQSGARGSLAASDAAVSEEELAGIVVCGSYIRPFTIDLGMKINLF